MEKIIRPTEEQINRGKEDDWGGFELAHGYGVFDFDGTGMYEVDRIDVMCTFETCEEAVKTAMHDGLPIIPVEELPEKFDKRYLGWIDTPENRARIDEYTRSALLNEFDYSNSSDKAIASVRAAVKYMEKYCAQ